MESGSKAPERASQQTARAHCYRRHRREGYALACDTQRFPRNLAYRATQGWVDPEELFAAEPA